MKEPLPGLTTTSDTSGTMLHCILQPLAKSRQHTFTRASSAGGGRPGGTSSRQPCAPSQEASPETPAVGTGASETPGRLPRPTRPLLGSRADDPAAPTNPALGALLGRGHMAAPRGEGPPRIVGGSTAARASGTTPVWARRTLSEAIKDLLLHQETFSSEATYAGTHKHLETLVCASERLNGRVKTGEAGPTLRPDVKPGFLHSAGQLQGHTDPGRPASNMAPHPSLERKGGIQRAGRPWAPGLLSPGASEASAGTLRTQPLQLCQSPTGMSLLGVGGDFPA